MQCRDASYCIRFVFSRPLDYLAFMANNSRRKFLRDLGSTAAMIGAAPLAGLAADTGRRVLLHPEKRVSANDKIRIAGIGMGIMGFGDVSCALKVPGVELVAVADLYDGHLEKAKSVYGKDIYTTRDYREILERKDVDAVIIATPDHWHDTQSIAALEKGKAVYCEKPMTQQIEEGHKVIATQQRTKGILQVGSQRVSSVALAEAKRRYQAGDIGRLNLVEAKIDRHSALGAWQYSIPTDASPATIDWDTFLKDTTKMPFDPVRFFRWRNYQAYGTGVPGDLFVHLITGLHFITGSKGPNRIFASGNLVQWQDGRDVPDLMVAIFEYPETPEHPSFQMQLRVNFADGGGGGIHPPHRLRRRDGTGLERFYHQTAQTPKAPGYGGWDTYNTFTKDQQEAFVKDYMSKYSEADRRQERIEDIKYSAPKGTTTASTTSPTSSNPCATANL